MFDGYADTYWHSVSPSDYANITVSFDHVVSFRAARITVYREQHDRYRNICVFLNAAETNDGDEEVCTSGDLEVTEAQVLTLSSQSPKQTTEVYIRFGHGEYANVAELDLIYSGK